VAVSYYQELWKQCEADPAKMAEMMRAGAEARKEKNQRIGGMLSASNRDGVSSSAIREAQGTKEASKRPRAGQMGHLQ